MRAAHVCRELKRRAAPQKGKRLARFFKTGPGEYAAGDVFWGVTVPETRAVARQYRELSLAETEKLLRHRVHEVRLCALVLLAERFARSDEREQKRIVRLYLAHTRYINNWDLVDVSAPKILGAWLATRPRQVLRKLARSESLWERRIAILSTFAFIVRGESADALAIAEELLADRHDLIHKAVGWMLREVGKRVSRTAERAFLDRHAAVMPRTMLRYALEHFPSGERQRYLAARANAAW
jgi:3-methyladenine DNA glycosylase AlkD